MKQLTGIDTTFLNIETATSFGHINSLSIYQRPKGKKSFDAYRVLYDQIESKLGLLEPFRRRLVEVPLGLDRPYWINDPDFDLDFHVRHIGVPGEGSDEQVGDLVGRLIGRPMDRTRPLWEAYVIEGLASGDFAVLLKLHHSTIDGAAGAEMLAMLLDPQTSEDHRDWTPEAEPGTGELLARTAYGMVKTPVKGLRLQIKMLNELGRVTRNQGFTNIAGSLQRGIPGPAGDIVKRVIGAPEKTDEQDQVPLVPRMGGPRTPFNATITAHRRFAYRAVPFEHIRAIKNELGATVNDVVMAVCAGGLRRYLASHDELPDENLIAMIPVSIRTGEETEKWSNRVSAIFADLPTAVDDPVQRVSDVHESMISAKGQFDLMPADMIADLSDLAPPALAMRAARLAARTRLADRTNPPANLIVSNVPGPRAPLHLGDAQLLHYFPVSTVVDGQGLNITVQSYVGWLDFGLVACRELVPDLWDLLDMIIDDVYALADDLGLKLKRQLD